MFSRVVEVAKRRESVRKQHGALFSLERDRTAVDRRPLPSDIHNFAFCILHFALSSRRPLPSDIHNFAFCILHFAFCRVALAPTPTVYICRESADPRSSA